MLPRGAPTDNLQRFFYVVNLYVQINSTLLMLQPPRASRMQSLTQHQAQQSEEGSLSDDNVIPISIATRFWKTTWERPNRNIHTMGNRSRCRLSALILLCWAAPLSFVTSFQSPIALSRYGDRMVAPQRPAVAVPSQNHHQSSTSLNMFMGSDGGVLGIGTPELVGLCVFDKICNCFFVFQAQVTKLSSL